MQQVRALINGLSREITQVENDVVSIRNKISVCIYPSYSARVDAEYVKIAIELEIVNPPSRSPTAVITGNVRLPLPPFPRRKNPTGPLKAYQPSDSFSVPESALTILPRPQKTLYAT
jgi:hypothetical protein